jgi:uncharacterized protein (DUF1778 family)
MIGRTANRWKEGPEMESRTEKRAEARMDFRLPAETKEIIEQAALVAGQTVTDFAVAALVHSAHETLEHHAQRRLTARDRDAFLRLLDEDARPNDALKQAARSYKKKVRGRSVVAR